MRLAELSAVTRHESVAAGAPRAAGARFSPMDDRGLDDNHLRAAVRLTLRAQGFSVSVQDVATARERWQKAGECLLAGELQSRLPAFVRDDTFSSTPYL